MKSRLFRSSVRGFGWISAILVLVVMGRGDEPSSPPKAFVDGTGSGWRALGEEDFVGVNCRQQAWSWKQGSCIVPGNRLE